MWSIGCAVGRLHLWGSSIIRALDCEAQMLFGLVIVLLQGWDSAILFLNTANFHISSFGTQFAFNNVHWTAKRENIDLLFHNLKFMVKLGGEVYCETVHQEIR